MLEPLKRWADKNKEAVKWAAVAAAAGVAVTFAFNNGNQVTVNCGDGPPVATADLGWAGPAEVASAADSGFYDRFRSFKLRGRARDNTRKNVRLWVAYQRRNGGRHLLNVRQEIGDCVSWGWSNGCTYALAQNPDARLERVFPPAIYGFARVDIGGGKLDGDGAIGAWAAEAVSDLGVVSERGPPRGLPRYSGRLAKQWGDSPGPPREVREEARRHRVRVQKVSSASDVMDAICNGYPVPICSSFGTKSIRERWGRQVAAWDDSWMHCMCVIAYDGRTARGQRLFYILNSWGPDAHPTPLQGEPPGGFWVTWDDMDRIARMGDSFAVSGFDGFNVNDLDFRVFGEDPDRFPDPFPPLRDDENPFDLLGRRGPVLPDPRGRQPGPGDAPRPADGPAGPGPALAAGRGPALRFGRVDLAA